MMKQTIFPLLIIIATFCSSCSNLDDADTHTPTNDNDFEIKGFNLLSDLKGHWVGSNQTVFGHFDWFAFDFRPISSSHLHSIYEGGTNQNIITSIFVGSVDGKSQIMARNGGWLGNQYRATYFILDKEEMRGATKYYRLVDAIGGSKRAYMEFQFEGDSLFFDAYKDNSGALDEPIHHMGFKGTNYNPSFAKTATTFFNFPQKDIEVSLENKFVQLIDTNSALFLREIDDPFPKSQHAYISDLKININRDSSILGDQLLLYISAESLINTNGQLDLNNINTKVIRTVDVLSQELFYEATYLHPDKYYVTAFSDKDNNSIPTSGDVSSSSKEIIVDPDSKVEMNINIDITL